MSPAPKESRDFCYLDYVKKASIWDCVRANLTFVAVLDFKLKIVAVVLMGKYKSAPTAARRVNQKSAKIYYTKM